MTARAGRPAEMTAAELAELGRGAVSVDPSTVPRAVLGRVAVYNRRVRMMEALLRRAGVTLASGAPIEPEFAETIRFAASALRAGRLRLAELIEAASER